MSAAAPGPLAYDGRYRILQRLGAGGMAEVFLAEQVSLGRKVAIKVLHRSLTGTPGMTERLRREALLLSTVDHPCVVRVLDFATGEEGDALVLEYVEGQRLDLALQAGAFEPARALRVLRCLADGLAAIHAIGIVHRDLKPENVVLAGGGTTPELARLLDFGVARLFEAASPTGDGRSFVTQAGLAVGTPAYVAPEQVRGLPCDPRTDVYSFGVTAYFVLAGRLPFQGPAPGDFLKQQVEDAPPELATVAPALFAAAPGLAALVMGCLAKRPADRPADGAALAAALAALAPRLPAAPGETPIRAAPPPPSATQASPAASPGGLMRAAFAVGLLASLLIGLAPAALAHRLFAPAQQARLLLALDRADLALKRLEATGADPAGSSDASVLLPALLAVGKREDARRLLAAACHRALVPGGGPGTIASSRAGGQLPQDAEGAACAAAADRRSPP